MTLPDDNQPVDPTRAAPSASGGSAGQPDEFQAMTKQLRRVAEVLGVLAVFSIPFYALRLIFVAHGDVSVALALLSDATLASLGIAILISFLPVLAFLFVLSAAEEIGLRTGRRASPDVRVIALLVMASLLLFVFGGDLKSLIGYAGGVLAFGVYGVIRGRRIAKSSSMAMRFDWSRPLIPVVVLLLAGPYPLQAPERAVIDGKPRAVATLRDDGTSLELFDFKNAEVIRVAKERISDLQFCKVPGIWRPMSSGGSMRPDCPR